MKRFMVIVAAALLAVGCNNTKNYVIEGNIEGLSGEVSITSLSGEIVFATEEVVDGTFEFNVECEYPVYALFSIDNTPITPVFLDSSPLQITGSMDAPETIIVSGSDSNDAFAEFNKIQMEILLPLLEGEGGDPEAMMSAFAYMREMMNQSYIDNADNLWGAYILVSSRYQEMSPEEILEALEAFPKEYLKIEELETLKRHAEGLLNTSVGCSYIEIALPDVEGKEIALSSVLKENKVVLLDFWASWCRPCMDELPYLLEAYEKYHDKGFEIYGVSLDEDAEPWQKTIEANNMNWINVSDVAGWQTEATNTYSVSSIPSNFLIDSNGVIIAKDLRGENLLEELAKIFE